MNFFKDMKELLNYLRSHRDKLLQIIFLIVLVDGAAIYFSPVFLYGLVVMAVVGCFVAFDHGRFVGGLGIAVLALARLGDFYPFCNYCAVVVGVAGLSLALSNILIDIDDQKESGL